MAAHVNIRQAGTLLLEAVCAEDDGTPVDLSAVQLSAEPRDVNGNPLGPLTITVTDAAAGVFTLSATSAETASWPPGQLSCDLCFVSGDTVIYSDIFYFRVRATVTPPP